MTYTLRQIGAMLATAAGRLQLRAGLRYRFWPVLSRLARIDRRTRLRSTRVIAVVGSLGKTTTSRAIATALEAPIHEEIWANAWSSVALALLRIRRAQRHAVVEAGIAGPGEMSRYARMIGPDVTVVTSVAGEHRTRLLTLETTRAEKSRMVAALGARGTAVLNGDDPNVLWMRGATSARIVTYGFAASCDVRADNVRLDWPAGTRFRLSAFGEEREAFARLIGRHSLYAALAAVAVARSESVPLDEALGRLESLPPTIGRMQPVALPGGAWVLRDDYKSTPETIHSALDVLAEVPAVRRLALLGNVWEEPVPLASTYRALGARVARLASLVVVVGKGRASYRAGALEAGMAPTSIIDGEDSPQAITAVLRPLLRAGDVLLIKGHRAQRLGRVCLLLQGQAVRCGIPDCHLRTVNCEDCPMLKTGWGNHRPVT